MNVPPDSQSMADPPPSTHPRAKWPAWIVPAAVAAVLAIGIGAFLATRSTGTAKANASNATAPATAGANGATGFAGRPGTSGTIASINGSTLTIADQTGASTNVTAGSATKVSLAKPATLADVKVGDRITATGTSTGTNAITAARVSDQGTATTNTNAPNGSGRPGGPSSGSGTGAGAQPPGGFANGTVASINADTITITTRQGTSQTVTVTSATTYTKSTPGAVSDLRVGQSVAVTGTTGSNGTVTATAIREGSTGLGARGGFGGSNPTTPTTT